jgi:hypothetical protein
LEKVETALADNGDADNEPENITVDEHALEEADPSSSSLARVGPNCWHS